MPGSQPTFTDDALLLDTLERYWGYTSFRPAQLDIIRSVMSGHDTIGLLPTGGGKSITFQVPAMILPGLTIVITPLISLMKDQVDHLLERDIRAVCIHSGMTRHEVTLAIDKCRLGKARLLYVSPERLLTESFRATLHSFDISLIVVDEAHCISQWGYDFRPSYLQIASLRALAADVPVLALTASATPAVITDIAARLLMKQPDIHRLSFTRKNISYIVRNCDYKEGKMLEVLNNTGGSAIVYVRSRKRTRELAEYLCSQGISAEYYHAGLQSHDKDERQTRWSEGRTRVMVATNAFGMGIDKPDVRAVIHFDLPSSLEEYYQESGRAGRDGLPSFAVVLANKYDAALLSRRLADSFPEKDVIRRVYELVGNYLDVAVGEGYNQVFAFNRDKFCVTFKMMPATVHNALSILTRAGYIEYTDELSQRARVMLTVTRHELYDIQLPPEQERVLNFILRTTSGAVYSDYQHIDESLIASSLGYTEQTVYEALLALARRRVLNFVPRSISPYIYYTTSREDPQHLLFPLEVYEYRRKAMQERIEAMKAFVFSSDECRVNIMLRYFGETPEEDCGTCDVCRSRVPRARVDIDSLEQTIIYQASHPGGTTIDDIVYATGIATDRVIEHVRTLIDAGRLHLASGRLTTP